MKAITVWQPWAWLLAAGIKHDETRSWRTNYRGESCTKIIKDRAAKKTLEKRSDDHNARWQLLRFFRLRFEKQKVIAIPHYEFAQGIELDADPELIAVIIDYLEKKKKAYEAEFERIGDEDRDRAENETD